MVNKSIMLGHIVSSKWMEVESESWVYFQNIDTQDIRNICSFLGHIGFYRRFIKDFSNITEPLSHARYAVWMDTCMLNNIWHTKKDTHYNTNNATSD